MASSDMIPRTFESDLRFAPRGQVWDAGYNPHDHDLLEEHTPNWGGTAAVGVIFVIIGLVSITVSVGGGVGFVVFGIMIIAVSYLAWNSDLGLGDSGAEPEYQPDYEDYYIDWRKEAWARQEMRQRDIDEIVKAVKSTIRVRCQYCGTLNEESANKCESCGASL